MIIDNNLYFNFKDIKDDNFLIKLLKKNGFIVIKNVISKKDINKSKKIVKKYFNKNGIKITNGKIQPAASNFIHELDFIFGHKKILQILKIIFRNKKFIYTNHSDVQFNLASSWHKDSGEVYGGYFKGDYFNDPKCEVYKIGIYLQNSDHKNEGLSVKIGSHRFSDINIGSEVKIDTKKGDIIIFDVRLTHKGKKETKIEKILRLFQKIVHNFFLEKYFSKKKSNRYSIFFSFGKNDYQTKMFSMKNDLRQNKQNKQRTKKISNNLEKILKKNGIGLIG